MRLILLVCLCAGAVAAGTGGRAEYLGGTLPGLTEGAEGHIRCTDPEFMEFDTGRLAVRVPWERINQLEYGQKVDRRLAMAVLISPMFLLSKSRRHFLTVGYADDDGRQQALIFRVDKKDVRAVLVILEARSGRKVQYQDEEARKAGKG